MRKGSATSTKLLYFPRIGILLQRKLRQWKFFEWKNKFSLKECFKQWGMIHARLFVLKEFRKGKAEHEGEEFQVLV